MIKVTNLEKIYKVPQKEKGILKTLFCRKFNEVKAVKGINFSIEHDEIVGLIGLNGAGKTTTLKMLSGLIKPTSGEVRVLEYDPWKRKNDFLMKIGFLMGNKSQLSWDISAMDSFLLEAEIYKLDKVTFNRTLDELTTLLNVKELLDTPVRKLSLGQRMKLELILTLLHKPKILFLDEPTLGLDIISQQNIRKFLNEYRKKEKATIIITSHNMKDIEDICDRVIIIDKGVIIYDGTIDDLKKTYENLSFEDILIKMLKGDNYESF